MIAPDFSYLARFPKFHNWYLSPVVGERNEPANVLVTLKEIARIKGLSVEDAGKEIFKNAERLFGV